MNRIVTFVFAVSALGCTGSTAASRGATTPEARRDERELSSMTLETRSGAARCARVVVVDASRFQLPVTGASIVATEGAVELAEQYTQPDGQARVCAENPTVPVAQRIATGVVSAAVTGGNGDSGPSHETPGSAQDGVTLRISKPGYATQTVHGPWESVFQVALLAERQGTAPATR